MLHPLSACGARVEVRHVDGRISASTFPDHILPWPPFMLVRALRHEWAPGRWAEAELRGLRAIVRPGDSVIVLASAAGGTPVLMESADSLPDVPLAVQVVRSDDGGADVLIPQSLDSGWDGLPAPVADELAELPGLLDRALG